VKLRLTEPTLSVGRNLIVALLAFAAMVALDYFYIQRPTIEIELLLLLPLSLLLYLAVPYGFWLANRNAFRSRAHGNALRIVLALLLSVTFAAMSFLPFLEIHTRMGGRE